jgi:hypothetical protein
MKSIRSIRTKRSLTYARIVEAKGSSMTMIALLESGAVETFLIDQTGFTSAAVGNVPVLNFLFVNTFDGFVAMEPKNCVVYVIKETAVLVRELNLTAPRFIASSQDNIFISGISGKVMRWRKRQMKTVASVSHDYMSCFDVDLGFGILAVGTKDGRVIVFWIGDGSSSSFLWSRSVERIPRKTVITRGSGFVLVETERELLLFSINGKMLQRVEIAVEIAQLVTWTCERGIDFIGVIEKKGTIRVFEAFYMRIDEFVHECGVQVISLSYNFVEKTVVVVTAYGDIISIPRELPS